MSEESIVVENAVDPGIDVTPRPPKARAKKTLDSVNTQDVKEKVSDVVVIGDPDLFQLLCKANSKSEGWMKSAKAMECPSGCIVQVTTQNGDEVAEALVFVPGTRVVEDVNGGRRLAKIS